MITSMLTEKARGIHEYYAERYCHGCPLKGACAYRYDDKPADVANRVNEAAEELEEAA